MIINFTDVTKAAVFCTELVKAGVAFKGRERENGTIDIELTGGY